MTPHRRQPPPSFVLPPEEECQRPPRWLGVLFIVAILQVMCALLFAASWLLGAV